MKCVGSEAGSYLFVLGKREKRLLTDLLSGYPRVPPDHHKLSKTQQPADAESQQLVKESLADQRRTNKTILGAFLNDPGKFRETEHGFKLTLSATEVDWLLEMLNDIRVGSWVAMGCPEEIDSLRKAAKTSPDLWFMELAGIFQMQILQAIDP